MKKMIKKKTAKDKVKLLDKKKLVISTEDKQRPQVKNKGGRPKGILKKPFTSEDIDKIKNMAGIGLSYEMMAAILGISKSTFERRLRENPDVSEAVALGRASATHMVASKAFNMASSGKNYKMTQYWLNCRAKWQASQKIELATVKEIDPEQEYANKIAQMTPEELQQFIAEKERKTSS